MYCLGKRLSFLFWQKGNIIFVTFIRIYRKNHLFMNFFRKTIFHFPSRKKNKKKTTYFREKRKTTFPDITKKIIFQCDFFGKTIFLEDLNKTSYFHVFSFRKIILPFPSKEWDHIFGKKKYHLSWKHRKGHTPVRLFWRDQLFRTFAKRKYGFSCSVLYSNWSLLKAINV